MGTLHDWLGDIGDGPGQERLEVMPRFDLELEPGMGTALIYVSCYQRISDTSDFADRAALIAQGTLQTSS